MSLRVPVAVSAAFTVQAFGESALFKKCPLQCLHLAARKEAGLVYQAKECVGSSLGVSGFDAERVRRVRCVVGLLCGLEAAQLSVSAVRREQPVFRVRRRFLVFSGHVQFLPEIGAESIETSKNDEGRIKKPGSRVSDESGHLAGSRLSLTRF